jgi:hypothetical protein
VPVPPYDAKVEARFHEEFRSWFLGAHVARAYDGTETLYWTGHAYKLVGDYPDTELVLTFSLASSPQRVREWRWQIWADNGFSTDATVAAANFDEDVNDLR